MNISGIRPYEGFYDYNSIKTAELRGQQIASAQMKGAVDEVAIPENFLEETTNIAPEQSYTSYDYAKMYRAEEQHELKGLDSDIYSLDTQKAVSDLDKDYVLRQYQYFVGQSQDVIGKSFNASEKVLRSGENFSL